MRRKVIALFGSVLMLGLLVGCRQINQTTSVTTNSAKIRVVTSLDFYADAARAILKNRGEVASIITSPSVDPHDYTPTTADAKQVAGAQIVVANGAGYDSWLTKLAQADDERTQKTINIANEIAKLPEGGNEHLWYDFTVMTKVTRRLITEFSKLQPKNAAYFATNGQKYLAKLGKLKQQEQQLKVKLQGQKVMVTEPVFDYVLQSLKMTIVNPDFAHAIEEGADPKPADLQKMQQQLKKAEVSCLVVNSQVSSALVTNLIKQAKAADVPVLYVTETLPKGQNYLTWMTKQLTQLATITR